MRFLFCIFVITFFAGASGAQERFRDWTLVQAEAGCAATISVGLAQGSTGLLTVGLLPRRGAGDFPAVITVRVPVGAALTEPLSYAHPGETAAVPLAWQACDARTCLATGGVSSAELAKLQRGRRVFMAYRPLPGSRSLIVPVSLLGVTAAWQRVLECR